MGNLQGRLLIASGVIGLASVMYLAAFVANGYYQVKNTGMYIPPADLVSTLKMLLGASVFVLTWGSATEARHQIAKKEVDQIDDKSKDS